MGEATGRGGGLSARWAQMARQRQLIESRRELLQQRQASAENIVTSPSPLNAFSNDGSFLDKFKKLSEPKTVKKTPVKHNFNIKINALESAKKLNTPKPETEAKNINTDKNRNETSDRHRTRNKSRSRSRERNYDTKRNTNDKRDRPSQRWDTGNRNSRKRSYSPCTPIIEDMPHRKPSRFTNILPPQINTSIAPANHMMNFNVPKMHNVIPSAFMNQAPNIRQMTNAPVNHLVHHLRPNLQPKLPFAGPPTILPPHLGSGFNERIGISLPPPLIIINNNGTNLNIPPPPVMTENVKYPIRNIPLHTIPEPKPLDAILIPPPKPLDAISIPKPKPLDAITIPPPKPMNLHAIPPPSPICLTQIPKPKEIDLCSIPHPPLPDVLSTGGRISPTMEAAAKQVAQNGDSWELTLISDSARADSMWYLSRTQSAEYKLYRSLVMKYRNELKNSTVKEETITNDSQEKYEPEFSLRDDSSNDEDSSSEKSFNEDAPDKKSGSLIKMHFDKVKSEDLSLIPSSKIVERLNTQSDSEDDDAEKKESKAKRRKSRWGDTAETIPTPSNIGLPGVASVTGLGVTGLINVNTLPVSIPKIQPQLTKINRQDTGLLQYAMKTYGNTNLSDEDWKKCEDHYKISLLYQELLFKRHEIEKLTAAGRFKYEYDSDEEIDESGTWEHRLRQQEMEATQRWAVELTRQATGKHHIGDFLPPDELKRFMDKYSTSKGGKEPDLSDYKEFKLKEDNIGFKMLQKLGWSEGEGLGADGSGITNPINKSNQRDTAQGLGGEQADSLAEGDDEFDAYRKRMMLAYRFRPNPLNNPRRPYY